jgi:hypothetical protein
MFSDKSFRAELNDNEDAGSLYAKLVNWNPAERNMA